ncbi:hypothetical protein B0H66DRAFT_610450 [Apodospora peruviana]|uniref:RING-type domain-containing protein n=1 Tax=Apodospora peruviana TaxID=516989 RepID=A0AAE0IRA7_9PEZI|nr:hypothetical protein B0H66DRAFT_610450 [Apodospora peruviana]
MVDNVHDLLFSNPSWQNVGTVPNTIIRNITAVSSHLAYAARISENITVLASRSSGTKTNIVQGLLYVPELPANDPCVDELVGHVPDSAARRSDLPPANYNLIALAPWVSADCSKSYLDAARTDPLRGFIFYRPDNSSDGPLPVDAPEWDIDGDAKWKTQSAYTVFAVSGLEGQHMMQNLSRYSGKLTTVPFGPNISRLYSPDPSDYVRIWTALSVTSSPSLPHGLWVYALIIIGVLLGVVLAASCLMHFVQSRRRSSLRRRVVAGQVNLEGLGIKRLTVPLDHIQKFPLFTYHYEPSVNSPPTSPRSPRQGRGRRGSRGEGGAPPMTTVSLPPMTVSEKGPASPSAAFTVPTDYQPGCEICLEQYQNRVTIIRELPCGHIFHPECIEEFLHEVSSLCPLCKACMLPQGYCPKITNAMVRRERAIRRLRDRVVIEDLEDDTGGGHSRIQSWGSTIKKHMFSAHTSTPTSSTSTELQSRSKQAIGNRESGVIQQQPDTAAGESNRSNPTDLARKRMRELAGSELEDGERLTKWKRMRTRIFPGF